MILPKEFINKMVEVTVVPVKQQAKGKSHTRLKSFITNPIKLKSIKPWTRDELYAR